MIEEIHTISKEQVPYYSKRHERAKRLNKEEGLNLRQIAERFNVSRQRISQILKEPNPKLIWQWERICPICGDTFTTTQAHKIYCYKCKPVRC